MERWRDSALAAVSFVVAFLDERLAEEELAEDVIIFDDQGDAVGAADRLGRVRTFPPSSRVLAVHRSAMESFAGLDLTADDPLFPAGRWYLRAAQLGPVPDAVVFLWVALEALARPPWGVPLTRRDRRRGIKYWIERALGEAGVKPDQVEPSLGELSDLRAAIVHGGVEEPPLLSEGFYALEALVRLLIRQRLHANPLGWPIGPNASNLREPLRTLDRFARRFPKTEWLAPRTESLGENHPTSL